jgi:protein-S-isoprenylcysteine O-methyltransferase Ste14
VLVFLPARVLIWSGIEQPAEFAFLQVLGMVIGAAGAVVAASCVGAFIFIGRGTPAPFDPPRRLVVVGPYRFVRNPMYVGAAFALGGAAVFYVSWMLAAYTAVFLAVTHLFVVAYEEPRLREMFEADYANYCARVRRWLPTRRAR